MSAIAHSKNFKGEIHSLKSHLYKVSDLMSNFTKNNYIKVFKITGLLHDLGKYQVDFQQYLIHGGRRGSVPHASWGASIAKKYKLYEAAFAIDGHHKGLPNFADLKDDINETVNKTDFTEVFKRFLADLQIKEEDLNNQNFIHEFKDTERDLFIRYLFSALTDADWLDTEKHFNPEKTENRQAPAFNADLLIQKIENEIRNKSKEGDINKLRNKVREFAITRANDFPGFYSMTLPTGMGKTLASVSWALYHAKHNNLKRVIIVLPFISIIDQTANDLKRIFGEEWVLEHHSGYNEDDSNNEQIEDESFDEKSYKKRLATENWDYPFIVTTTVQFFESLFSNKPSKCRKIHNIADTVVIFDEVQTFPKELFIPTLSMLKDVHKIMNTSFLFCTATQPAFEKTGKFNGIDNIKSLVDKTEEIFNATKRVTYQTINNCNPISIQELLEKVIEKNTSVLCIFNAKAQTLSFFKELKKNISSSFRIFHLSTAMYPVHRKRVIDTIRNCLKNNEKIIVTSTQLIEAGADLDFPCVFREFAPLESIIQSAGRCNREGKLENPGEVFIFSLKDAATPDKQYRSMAEFATSLYKGSEELLNQYNFFTEYYRKMFDLFIPEDKFQILNNRKNLNFIDVANSYRIIKNNTKPLFVMKAVDDESKPLYEKIRFKNMLSRDDYRAMQQYSVQVYDDFIQKNINKIGQEPQGYWVWHGEYDKDFGISTDNPLLIL